MIELIIIGHGNFASGILSNVSLITGVPEHCNAIDFSFDISPDMISEKIAEIIESNPDNSGFLIFTDLLNGTPFNVSARWAVSNPKVKLVYGVNPAMLLETIMKRNAVDDVNVLAENAVETGKKQIVLFAFRENTDEEDDL